MSRYPEYDCPTIEEVMPAGQNVRMIFYYLEQIPITNHGGIPWKGENLQVLLDTDYTQQWSGSKYISPIVKRQLGQNATLTTSNYQTLAGIAWMRYWRRWKRLWDLYLKEYEPLQNYDMTEVMTDDETVHEYGKTHGTTRDLSSQRTDDLTHTRTPAISEMRTDNLNMLRTDNLGSSSTEQTTDTPNLTTHEDIYGFNSQDGNASGEIDSPAGANRTRQSGQDTTSTTGSTTNTGTQSTANTGTQTTTTTGTDTNQDTGTQTTTDTGTVSETDGGQDTDIRNYELTRSGNIGVTTSQQLAESEFNFWKLFRSYFTTVVYPDLDELLTLQIY